MAGSGFVRLAGLLGVLGLSLYGAAAVFGDGAGLGRERADPAGVLPETTRADTAPQAHALPAAVRRLTHSPVDGPLRPTIIGEAQPLPDPPLSVLTEPEEAATGDHRSVRVAGANVRGGPSTGFEVIGRVTQGEEVEVVESDGNGWVRIRIQGDGIDGWMAERLLAR